MRKLIKGVALALSLAITPAQAMESVYELKFADLAQNPAPLAAFRGKVLLLNFWATWCPPCVREMPSLDRLQKQFPDEEVVVVAVNVGESGETVEHFRNQLESPLDFRILLDERGSAFTELGIPGLPMTYLYDRNGNLIETHAGADDWDSDARLSQIRGLLEP